MKAFVSIAGCSRRRLDLAKLYRYLASNGYTIVTSPEKADYILVSTCAFNAEEEEASFQSLDRYRDYTAKKIVLGCLPDIAPQKYHARCSFEYVTPRNINRVDDLLEGITRRYEEIPDATSINPTIKHSDLRTALTRFSRSFRLSRSFVDRSFRYVRNRLVGSDEFYYLAVCRGCLGSCTYCAVRNAVGRVKSKSKDAVIEEFRRGRESGHRKFVVLGDDVGAYGQDIGGSFLELLDALLAESEIRGRRGAANRGVRFHIEELNPRWVVKYRDEIVPLLGNRRVKSILYPLQSGSNRMLDLMQRHNTIEDAADVIARVQVANPGIEVDTQVIVGFPSETQQDLEQTMRWIESLHLHRVTFFYYDEKENTPSREIQPKVPAEVIRERVRIARAYLEERHIPTALSCDVK